MIRGMLGNRLLGWATVGMVALIVLFMLIPAAVIVGLSFSNEAHFHVPPDAWGLRQYRAVLASPYWLDAFGKSFQIATPTAALSVLVGVPAVYALHRTGLPARRVIQIVALSPLIMPIVAYAVALYAVYSRVHIVGTAAGLVLSHAIRALPFVVLIVGAAINRVPYDLELVAMTLGASRVRAVLDITLRLIVPAVATSFIFAFLTSFDEAVFVTFLGGPRLVTLPKAIFDSEQQSVDPLITAIATVLMICTGLVMLLAVYWRSPRQHHGA